MNSISKIETVGTGSFGGKAQGLVDINNVLLSKTDAEDYQGIEFGIPGMTVIRTDVFDSFMKLNNLYEIAFSDMPDDRIAHAFQKANLPFDVLGDLRRLISNITTPLAIRSSSMLEDSQHEPFAGIYGTKMTPNNQADTTTRFNKLVEAIKYVYASTYFKAAKDYMKATSHNTSDEKMAVIIQEVIGSRHNDRYYPEMSGVARSYNFYAFGNARPEDGIVNLALGLGKTIVDGGCSWSFSPQFPRSEPPFGSISDMLKNTQNDFWSINMGPAPAYDPINEAEYMELDNIDVADKDKTLSHIASTLDSKSGRIIMGVGKPGPRIITFAPLLRLNEIPLVDFVSKLLKVCEQAVGATVEIEFAMTFHNDKPHQFGFLQVRPMVVSTEDVTVQEEELLGNDILCSSNLVLGNGIDNSIEDIIYVKTNKFDASITYKIAAEIEKINEQLVSQGRKYLLIGFGRWGTSDPWAGIPVNWGQISGAKVIIEAPLDGMNSELSQGSHFFHNVTGFGVYYFSIPYSGVYPINWEWFDSQKANYESELIRHIKLNNPLDTKVDGKNGNGIVSIK
jgi:pyruvate phosphate dikinase-like enzyme